MLGKHWTEEVRLAITCGIDWAENHHDVALIDETGKLVAKRRISDDAEGYRRLIELLVETGDTVEEPIPVAVETARGLLISCLRTTGRAVYSINPMAVARYRERHRVTRAKSDHADAMVLANILRTDADAHRPLPADTELVQAVAVLARAQQDAVWHRGQPVQSAALAPQAVLPGCPGRIPGPRGWAGLPRGSRGARGGTGPHVGSEADHLTALDGAAQGRSATQHRRLGPAAARHLRQRAAAPTATR